MDEIELLESQVKELKRKIGLLKRKKNYEIKIENINNKIRAFRPQVENGEMFLKDVAKEVCCGVKKVQKLATAENWDKTKNIKKNVRMLHLKTKSNFEYIKELSKHQKNKKAFEKPKEKDISDKQTEKLIFKNEKTIQGVLKKYCKDNIKKNIEKVLMVDGHLMQVKIHNRKVQVEHKPYLLQTYTEEYIKYVEAQKMQSLQNKVLEEIEKRAGRILTTSASSTI